ncbi:MAG: hypothetical protein MK171_05125 [Pirellulales bacterium]|nr:hypothetical protein [Pirellulales bacterium]
MSLLIQFLLRLTFGLAVGMGITPARLVTSGYFRNHLYVTLSLSLLAALLSYSFMPAAFGYAMGAAICSYVGSVYWLFEKPGPGKLLLLLVALAAWTGASSQPPRLVDAKKKIIENVVYSDNTVSQAVSAENTDKFPRRLVRGQLGQGFLSAASVVSSGLLLGMTMAAMLLGHWYLNTPTMELVPLRRLIGAMGVAVSLQIVISTLGLWGEIAATDQLSVPWILFVILRWTFGLLGVAVLTWMAWQTLKIPNTQSATGILYVAVIGTFVGETMALLLSSESLYPL